MQEHSRYMHAIAAAVPGPKVSSSRRRRGPAREGGVVSIMITILTLQSPMQHRPVVLSTGLPSQRLLQVACVALDIDDEHSLRL